MERQEGRSRDWVCALQEKEMFEQRAIFLVEDDDNDADLAERAFRRAKVSNPLVRARDGVEAIEYLLGSGRYAGKEAYDLPFFVILDLNIPKLNGLAVLKAIRASERTKHLPVIILTSSAEESDRLAAYDQYANSYIVKPLDYDKFVAATFQLCQYWTQLNAPAPVKEA
jgi:two-component system response regulator